MTVKQAEKRLMELRKKRDKRFFSRIESLYNRMGNHVEKELLSLYTQYGDENGLSLAQAKNFARMTDIKAFKADIVRFKRNYKNLSEDELKLLNEYELLAKINIQELIRARIGLTIQQNNKDIEADMREEFSENIIAELGQQLGIYNLFVGAKMPITENMLLEAIEGTDVEGGKWSKRLWENSTVLTNEVAFWLNQKLVGNMNYKDFARSLKGFVSDSVRKKRYVAERLARTESARMEAAVQTELWKQGDFKYYEYIAEGGKVCDVCKELDGKIFKLSEQERGKNMYPMHPNCRCSAVASMGKGFSIDDTIEAARSKPKTDEQEKRLAELRKKLISANK